VDCNKPGLGARRVYPPERPNVYVYVDVDVDVDVNVDVDACPKAVNVPRMGRRSMRMETYTSMSTFYV
jgi:hypothetical protein